MRGISEAAGRGVSAVVNAKERGEWRRETADFWSINIPRTWLPTLVQEGSEYEAIDSEKAQVRLVNLRYHSPTSRTQRVNRHESMRTGWL